VWDADTGKEMLTLPYNSPPVSGAHFSPDGRRLIVDGYDGYTGVWLSDSEVGKAAPKP